MSFEVIATDPFERKLKRLARKYNSLVKDLAEVINNLEENPTLGLIFCHNNFSGYIPQFSARTFHSPSCNLGIPS